MCITEINHREAVAVSDFEFAGLFSESDRKDTFWMKLDTDNLLGLLQSTMLEIKSKEKQKLRLTKEKKEKRQA